MILISLKWLDQYGLTSQLTQQLLFNVWTSSCFLWVSLLIPISSVAKKTLLIGWIYLIHERNICLQGKNSALFHQICFLKWTSRLVFLTILFFQNMECLCKSTHTLMNYITTTLLYMLFSDRFTGALDIFQQAYSLHV